MSTAVMPTQLDIGDTAFQSRRNSSSACRIYEAGGLYGSGGGGGERRGGEHWQMACATTTTTTTFFTAVASRHRNLSGPCSTGGSTSSSSTPRSSLDNRALATPPPGVPGVPRGERDNSGKDHLTRATKESGGSGGRNGSGSSSHHRKLDRSLSDSEDRLNGNPGRGGGVNSSRYKTELCRPFEESGHCKYGDKCQFAHGAHELRNLTRHPKYKTERCRTYHTIGFCPYGPRCHFIHNEDEHVIHQRKNANNSSARLSSSSSPTSVQKPCQFIMPPSSSSSSNNTHSSLLAHRPCNLSGLNSLGSSFESVSSSSSSPGNLSPSHLDDTFPPIGTFSPSALNDGPTSSSHAEPGQESSEVPTGTFFNFPASDAAGLGSIMTPLNIQTQQMYNNVLDMTALARFSAVLNISQNQNNQGNFSANLNMCQQRRQPDMSSSSSTSSTATESWSPGLDMGMVAFPPPSSSPHSAHSEDSMGSNGSLELSGGGSSGLDNAVHLVNSPLDLGRSMRLPIFNKFSSE